MINLVVAVGLNNEIGVDNQLLCNLEDDMHHFYNLTKGNIVVMGRKTYESIGHPLRDRQNIILSKREPVYVGGNVFFTNNIDGIIKTDVMFPSSQIYIIGGQEVYEQFLPHASRIYITRILAEFPEADRFFPEIDMEKKWKVINDSYFERSDGNEHSFYISTVERR